MRLSERVYKTRRNDIIYHYYYYETFMACRVYNYTLDTAKEMARNGWKLTGTFYGFLVFEQDY